MNNETSEKLTGESNASRGPSGKIQIAFESVSGESLAIRFNTLKRYYAPMLGSNTGDWVASQIKASLIRNIQNGTIVVTVNGQNVGLS